MSPSIGNSVELEVRGHAGDFTLKVNGQEITDVTDVDLSVAHDEATRMTVTFLVDDLNTPGSS